MVIVKENLIFSLNIYILIIKLGLMKEYKHND